MKVTNTYQASTVTAKKVWTDDKSKHPTIWFKLYRQIGDGAPEAVPDAAIQKLESGTTEVSWTVSLKDKDEYNYSVKEVDENGKDFVPEGYKKTEKGLTVTNRKKNSGSSGGGSVVPSLNKEDHFPYVVGYPEGTFRSEGNITRAEMTAIFSRLLKEKIVLSENYPLSFSDVARDSWYAEYIGHLTHVNVIAGYPDGTFKPDNPVTRGEFAAVASRFIGNKKAAGGFRDVDNEYWAKESIENVKAEGWIAGYPDGSFRPERYITRAEVVSIVNKMLDRNADKSYVNGHMKDLADYTDLEKDHWAFYPIMEASNGHDYTRRAHKEEHWEKHWVPEENK